MIKLFKKLIGGLVKMGTKVVHANFGRIIISTNKSVRIIISRPHIPVSLYLYIYVCMYSCFQELGAAKEYVNFILAAIIEKDIFACLTVFWLNALIIRNINPLFVSSGVLG